jgi:hypothetical protein
MLEYYKHGCGMGITAANQNLLVRVTTAFYL